MQKKADISPKILLQQTASLMRASRALYAATQLGVADVLADGPQTIAELSTRVGADPGGLRRMMRALVALGIFEETADARFGLNAAAELLRRDVESTQRAAVLFLAGQMNWQLWSDFLECVRTGKPVIDREIGKNIFERQQQNKEESELFEQAMSSFSAAWSIPIVTAYDFTAFKRITDVGGGTGRLMSAILNAAPNATGVLFDQPQVVANSASVLREAGVAARCQPVGGSFFEKIPEGSDLYVTKGVLHDWDDESCIKILSAIRAAMSRESKLLIIDRIAPERAEKGVSVDIYLLDLEMLVGSPSGRERTQSEFMTLLSKAGLTLRNIIPTASPVSMIEAQYE